jgi:hypothetical protein
VISALLAIDQVFGRYCFDSRELEILAVLAAVGHLRSDIPIEDSFVDVCTTLIEKINLRLSLINRRVSQMRI